MLRTYLRLLGGFDLELLDANARAPRSDIVRCLVAYLALNPDRAHPRAALTALLWPDADESHARHNLRQILYQLNSTLGGDARCLLFVAHDVLSLSEDVQCDVTSFLDHLAHDRPREAISLYQGEFLDGVASPDGAFAEWVEQQRVALHQRACDTFSVLARQALAEGDAEQALRDARRHAELDPFSEHAHQDIMRAQLALGDAAGARSHFRAFESRLLRETGLAPTTELKMLLSAPRKHERRSGTETPKRQVDLLEMPIARAVFGRAEDLGTLRRWALEDDCRLIAISGIGGIGKTSLAAEFVRGAQTKFEAVFWRSLSNTPPLVNVIGEWLARLDPDAAAGSDSSSALRALLAALQTRRSLLVLDNVESIFENSSGDYRDGYQDYAALFSFVGDGEHRGVLMLTSREVPHEVTRLQAGGARTRLLRLGGLRADAVRAMLNASAIEIDAATSNGITELYSGNPLAIKLAADAIQTLHGGDIRVFLADRDRSALFDDVRHLIDSQFKRLSDRERRAFFALVLAREPQTVAAIGTHNPPTLAKPELIDALRALQRRSLVESDGVAFSLQHVVLEYGMLRAVDLAVEAICDSTSDAHAATLLHTHGWLDTGASEHLRDIQIRHIVQPVARRLIDQFGHERVNSLIRERFVGLREHSAAAVSYAAGNLINVLAHGGLDASNLDCSGLTLRGAALAQTTLTGGNFSRADLRRCMFRQDFTVIKSLAFMPDGMRLVMGTAHGLVQLWNLRDEQLDWRTQTHNAFVWGLAVSPDGAMIASGGNDGKVCLLSAENGGLLLNLHTHANEITSVAFGRDGAVVYSACAGGVLRAVAVSGSMRWEVALNQYVGGIALSPNGGIIACTCADGLIRLYDAASGAACGALHGHTARAKGIDISPDGRLLAAGGDDGTVRVWDLTTHKPCAVLTGHGAWVWGVRFSPDGLRIASSCDDQTVRIWRVASSTCESVIRGHRHWVRPIAFHPTRAVIISAADDQTVRMWDLTTGRPQWAQHGYTNWIRAIAFHPRDHTLAVGTADHVVRIWQPELASVTTTLDGHDNVVSSVAYSGDGRLLISGSVDATARVWDLGHGRAALMHVLRGHMGQVYAVASNADGDLLATGSADHDVILWHGPSGRRLDAWRHNGKVYALAFDQGGARLMSVTSGGSLYVWDARARRLIAEWRAHQGGAYAVAAHPDGALLASGGADDVIRIWDGVSGQVRATLRGHSGTIFSLAFSPDGVLLASGSYDRSVRLWDARTGEALGVVEHEAGFLRAVAFSADGRWLASGGADECVRVWRMPERDLIASFKTEPPYFGLNISGAIGLSAAQRKVLLALGAVDAAPANRLATAV